MMMTWGTCRLFFPKMLREREPPSFLEEDFLNGQNDQVFFFPSCCPS